MTVPLYWYKIVFMVELLIAEGLFTYKLKKKSNFAWRASASVVLCLAAAFAYPVLMLNAWYASLMFTSLVSFTMLCIKFCYNVSFIDVIFCGILSYTVQHLAYILYNLTVVSFNLVEAGALGTYLNETPAQYNSFTLIAYFIAYYVVYWLTYLFCGTKINKNEELSIGNSGLLLLTAVILLVVVVFNAVVVYYSGQSYDKVYLIMIYLGGLISCTLVLVIQFSLLDKKKLRHEVDTLQLLVYQEQLQYVLSKGNIELINIKCHDLKHKLSSFRGRLEDSEIEEMENAVMIYDSTVKTGNEVLDVILTEKSLKCNKNGIMLTCNIDNSKLDFISASDLYSLFGNLIENAIEAVLKISDGSQRVISLTIKSNNKLLSVHIENYYSGDIIFKDGLPQTTKEDDRFHGFGFKSIRMIVDKYNGNMLIRTVDGIFKIDILFPSVC